MRVHDPLPTNIHLGDQYLKLQIPKEPLQATVHTELLRTLLLLTTHEEARREKSLHEACSSKHSTSGCAQEEARQSLEKSPAMLRRKQTRRKRTLCALPFWDCMAAAAASSAPCAGTRLVVCLHIASRKHLFLVISQSPISEPLEAPAHIHACSRCTSRRLDLQGGST